MTTLTDDFTRTTDFNWGSFWGSTPMAPSYVTPGVAHIKSNAVMPRGDLMAHFGQGSDLDITYSVKLLEPPIVGESTIAIHKDLGDSACHLELVFRPGSARMQIPQVTRDKVKMKFPVGGNIAVPGIHPMDPVSIRVKQEGIYFYSKVWHSEDSEPTDWFQSVTGPAAVNGVGNLSIMVGHGEDEPIDHNWEIYSFNALV